MDVVEVLRRRHRLGVERVRLGVLFERDDVRQVANVLDRVGAVVEPARAIRTYPSALPISVIRIRHWSTYDRLSVCSRTRPL